jgi:hypothetical protein
LQGERKNPADRNPKALNRRGRNREEAITVNIVAVSVNDVNKIFDFFHDRSKQTYMRQTLAGPTLRRSRGLQHLHK